MLQNKPTNNIQIQKFKNTTEDCVLFYWNLSRNIEASATLRENLINTINEKSTINDVKKFVATDKRFIENYNKEMQYNEKACGMYKILLDGKYAGMIGATVKSLNKQGLVNDCSFRIQLLKRDGEGKLTENLIGKRLSVRAGVLYANNVKDNIKELDLTEGRISSTTMLDNSHSNYFQKSIGTDAISDITDNKTERLRVAKLSDFVNKVLIGRVLNQNAKL